MPDNEEDGPSERDRTDESLRQERERTDRELQKTGTHAEQVADQVVDRARTNADETLHAARATADMKLADEGASPAARRAHRSQEAIADTVLDSERKVADDQLKDEREQRREAITGLLQIERGATDQNLSRERSIADERVAAILRELTEAMRLRDEFLLVASHELRTPLTPLSLRLQSLAKEAARQPETPFARYVRRYIETATRQVRRFQLLIADLLDVSKIAQGRLTLALGWTDLGALVHEVRERLRSQIEAAGCVVELDVQHVRGFWDEMLLDQVVTSLFENAIKYGAGKPVRVRVLVVGDAARLSVEDEGIGMSAETRTRIFQRFERGVSHHHYGGLGLSLYLCRTVIEALSGSISVKSEAGRGSMFTVELPVNGPSDAPSPAPLSAALSS